MRLILPSRRQNTAYTNKDNLIWQHLAHENNQLQASYFRQYKLFSQRKSCWLIKTERCQHAPKFNQMEKDVV